MIYYEELGEDTLMAKGFADLERMLFWLFPSFIVYQIWDITTLMLYACKIRSFRKWRTSPKGQAQNCDVYCKIMFLLHRVVILTLFYAISALLLTLSLFALKATLIGMQLPMQWTVLDVFIRSTLHNTLSMSMFLMMEHNTDWYQRFLFVIRRCCCRIDMVEMQLSELRRKEISTKRKSRNITMDTHGVSEHYEPRVMPRFSAETVTVVHE